MKKIKGKDFINVINVLKEKGLSTVGQGDVVTQEVLKNQPSDVWRLFYNIFWDGDIIGTEDFMKKTFSGLFEIALYYYFFYNAYGKTPFNLARVFYYYIHVGYQFGHNQFNICTKKEIKGDILSISTIWCNDGLLPQFGEEKNSVYDFSADNKNFINIADDFSRTFKDENHPHYPQKYGHDEKYCNLDIIEATEASIRNNQKALEILKRLYTCTFIL